MPSPQLVVTPLRPLREQQEAEHGQHGVQAHANHLVACQRQRNKQSCMEGPEYAQNGRHLTGTNDWHNQFADYRRMSLRKTFKLALAIARAANP